MTGQIRMSRAAWIPTAALGFAAVAAGWLASSNRALGGEPTGALKAFATSREWSDESGKFKITASLQFADDQTVKLKKSDGLVVTVPLDKLSGADQGFIRGFLLAEKSMGNAAPDPANPFAGGVPDSDGAPDSGGGAKPAAGPTTPAGGGLPRQEPILRGFRPLVITPKEGFWSAKPPIPFPNVQFEDQIAATTLAKPFFAAMRVMAAGEFGLTVLNAYRQSRKAEENYSRFVLIGGKTGEVSTVFEYEQPWKLMAISPDGSRFAAVRVEGFDKGNDLALFRIENGQVLPEYQFKAGGGAWDELHWVAFLPGNRLATISQKHDLTFWELGNRPKAVARGSTGGSMTAEISAAGELMAFPFGSSIAVLETMGGKLVGCINRDEPAKQLAFSPKGDVLAAFHPFTVTLYSTENGEPVRTIAVSESDGALRWVGDYLLVGTTLYDVEQAVPMWTYAGRPAAQTTLGDRVISGFGDDKGSTVTIHKLPHEEAIRTAKNIDPDQIYSIVPGDSISVNYELGGAPANVQQQVRQAVEGKLQKLGWKIATGAANTMTVALKQGAMETAEYYTRRGFGPIFAPPGFGPPPSGPAEKVQYRSWTHEMLIVNQGKQVFQWKATRSAPQNLQSKEGESTQAAVNRYCQPTPAYFANVALAPHLLKPEYREGLGKSTFEPSGLR